MNWTVLWRRSSWALTAMKRPEFAALDLGGVARDGGLRLRDGLRVDRRRRRRGGRAGGGGGAPAAPEASSKRRPPAKFWEK